jgi:HSP20 family molecular chaperone IbpA
MDTQTHRIIPCHNERHIVRDQFQAPRFQVSEKPGSIEFEVIVPEVSPDSVELVIDNGELIVTALRNRPVRMNWQAANLEGVQPDYQLRIKLDALTKLDGIWAVHREGILTIHMQRDNPLLPIERSAA